MVGPWQEWLFVSGYVSALVLVTWLVLRPRDEG